LNERNVGYSYLIGLQASERFLNSIRILSKQRIRRERLCALYRLNKRARFVRYWGEGHMLDSPANVRDMWQQVFRWFDEFLVIPEDKKSSSDQKPD